jgi:hypothetical protein
MVANVGQAGLGIAVPTAAMPGDLGVGWDFSTASFGAPGDSTWSGWTSVGDTTTGGTTNVGRGNSQYKILASQDIGAAISGQINGGTNRAMILIFRRMGKPISSCDRRSADQLQPARSRRGYRGGAG